MHKSEITMTFACLDCRKVFKKYRYVQGKDGSWSPVEYDVVCPQCKREMYETGMAFKAPKATDVKAWEKLRPLFESGYKFHRNFGNPFND